MSILDRHIDVDYGEAEPLDFQFDLSNCRRAGMYGGALEYSLGRLLLVTSGSGDLVYANPRGGTNGGAGENAGRGIIGLNSPGCVEAAITYVADARIRRRLVGGGVPRGARGQPARYGEGNLLALGGSTDFKNSLLHGVYMALLVIQAGYFSDRSRCRDSKCSAPSG